MNFILVTAKNKELLSELSAFATEIVREHYDPILGTLQNKYMLEKFQSAHAIKAQIESGYLYYLVKYRNKNIGFLAFYLHSEKLYLSKLYIHKDARKKGYASKMLCFIFDTARKKELLTVFLNVNKYNDNSISFYQYFGFKTIGFEKNDIGNGYYMDDYVMEITI